MNICEIMVYGGKHKWIDLSQRKDPNVKWFIFIGVDPKDDFPKHWERIGKKITKLEEQQKDFPSLEKIKYNYINIEFENELVNLIRYFRALINFVYKKGYKVICNLTAGVFELRIALFLASQIESDKILEIFYLNKQNFQKNLLFKSIKISKKGEKLLNILYEKINQDTKKKEISPYEHEYSLSQLRDICEKGGLDMDLPATSRLTSTLIEDGYLKERREGRVKNISLTEIGLIFCPIYNYLDNIQHLINKEDNK